MECGGSRAEVPLLAARPCGSHTSWTTHRKKGLIHPNSQGGSTAHELFETNSMPAHSPQPTTSPLPPNPSYQLHFPLLHLNNNHTYTRNDERYCSFCLPLPRIVNEPFFTAPTLSTLSTSNSKSHPQSTTIQSLGADNLHKHPKNSYAPRLHPLGSTPPKLDRQNEQAWTLLTTSTYS